MKQSIKQFISRYLPRRTFEELAIYLRVLVRTTIPNRLLPWRRGLMRRTRLLRGLLLNIGCGSDNPAGWFGIDFLSRASDLTCDVRLGMPLAEGSCRRIFSEHVFEHFDRADLRNVLRECLRILEPGGAIRIIVPDLQKYVAAYCANDGRFSAAAYTTQGHLEAYELMNDIFNVPTHRWIHDFESLRSEMDSAGFVRIEQVDQNASRFPEFTIDNQEGHRRAASLYVEAVRP